ncbi:MAG: hypothetical protein KC544_05750 [Gemmatimonadetes bacterium]|nr:hypothetical protein [Gemmatimonadota bacterium]
MIGHPREAALLRFLDGSGTDVERKRVAHHLADCQRCRDLVQGHRRVRQALVPVASSAPPALLDRVLATRAAGEGVILPVDVEPGPRREWRIPFSTRRVALGVLAASAVLAVGVVVVELLPRLPIAAAREETAKAFERLLEGLGNPRLGEPLLPRPDAPPAVIQPELMRELTATYEARYYAGGRVVLTDSLTTVRIRRVEDHWQLQTFEARRWETRWSTPDDEPRLDVGVLTRRETSMLDPVSLFPISREGLTRREVNGDATVYSYQQQQVDDSTLATMSARVSTKSEGPSGRLPKTSYLRVRQDAGPVGLSGGFGELLLLRTVTLSRWWAGSFTQPSQLPTNAPSTYVPYSWVISYRVTGSRRVELPWGNVDGWEVEQWSAGEPDGTRYVLRKSDGLLIASEPDSREPDRTELRLLSVSYP